MTFDSPILAPNGKPAWLEVLRDNPGGEFKNQWYEGSRWSPNRSWVWFPLQDAKSDLDRYTRDELNKHARYLYKNSPFIRGLIERLVTLIVGIGFHPTFKSSNPEWNTRAQAWYEKKGRNISLGPRASMSQYQRAIGRARFTDGECYSIKTFDQETFSDRVQGVEADVCCGSNDSNNKNIVDGKYLNSQGTVIAYKMRGVETPYEAADVVHHFTPNRLGQYSGETTLAAAINTARDVDDILALEKACVKDASSRKDIITTSSGELNPETYRAMKFGQSQVPFALPVDNKAKNDYYKIGFQAEPIVLRNGDTYTPYKPDRPGSAWQGFMEFLSNTICLSTGMPPSVILPIHTGGTDIRRDLDIAQRVADPIQLDIALELDEILDYFLDGEVADGELRDGAPDDYPLRAWHFPQKINVDRQQAAQDQVLVSAGLMSREEYHGRYSDDGDAYDLVIIEEAKKRRERIKAAGFTDIAEFVKVLSLDPKLFMSKPAGPGVPTTH